MNTPRYFWPILAVAILAWVALRVIKNPTGVLLVTVAVAGVVSVAAAFALFT